MATIVDRDLAVRLLAEQFAALDELYSGLAADQWELATTLPGWSVRDQLTHLLGTEASLLGEPMPDVDVSGFDHLRNPIAQANEAWVESLRTTAPADVLARWRDVTGRRLEALGAMTQADFDAPSWTPAGPDETYGRFMRIRHYDCFVHEHDEAYVNSTLTPSTLENAELAVVLFVARDGRAPSESSQRDSRSCS